LIGQAASQALGDFCRHWSELGVGPAAGVSVALAVVVSVADAQKVNRGRNADTGGVLIGLQAFGTAEMVHDLVVQDARQPRQLARLARKALLGSKSRGERHLDDVLGGLRIAQAAEGEASVRLAVQLNPPRRVERHTRCG